MNFLSPNIGFVRKIKVVYLGKFLHLLIEDILKQICRLSFCLVCSVDVAVGGFQLGVTEAGGDVDGDGKVTIIDVTFIQRHIAQLTTIPENRIACADTDKDGRITIIDATMIQRFIAQIIPSL